MGHEAINPSEVDAKIEAHRSDANAHHTKFTIAEHDTPTRHPYSVLKQSTGSTTGTIGNDAGHAFTLNDYSFFPSITTNYPRVRVQSYDSLKTDYVARFVLWNESGASITYNVYWRYLTASNNPQIWVIRDAKGEVIGIWQADDPIDADNPLKEVPIQCFDKDRNPVGIPHYIEVPSFYDEFLATLKEGFSEVKKRYLVRECDVRPKGLPQNVVFGRLVRR